MAKKPYRAGKQQADNQWLYNLWYERLRDACLTFIKWSGLPFEDIIQDDIALYLNEMLFEGRTVGLIKVTEDSHVADPVFGYIPVIGAVIPSDAMTWYGGSYSYTIQTKTDTFHATREAVALCRPSNAGRSLMNITARYARILTQIEASAELNVKHQNTPAIIQSPPGQELTYQNMYEQVAGYKPVVYGRTGLMGDEREGLFAYRYLQPAVYVADKLEMLKHDVLNDFYNEIGVSAKSIEKKAQLISDELNIDYSSNSLSKNTFTDPREVFCKQVKEIYGDEISFEFNVDVLNALRDVQNERADNIGSGVSGGKEGQEDDN